MKAREPRRPSTCIAARDFSPALRGEGERSLTYRALGGRGDIVLVVAAGAAVILSLWLSDIALLTQSSGYQL